MAKISIPSISSGFASTTALNNAFDSIETELNDKVLYRNNPAGEANQMLNNLDMNSNDIINVDRIQTTSLVVNGQNIDSNILATKDYVDSVVADTTVISRYFRYTANNGQTSFSGIDDNGNSLDYTVNFIDVYLNGIHLDPTDYTATTGTSIELNSPASTNDELYIAAHSTFNIANIIGSDVAITDAGGYYNSTNVEGALQEAFTPTATETTPGKSRRATTSEAQTGTEDTAYMTALKTKQAINALIGTGIQAYDADIPTVAATQAEMEAGTETALRSMSPLRVKQAIDKLAIVAADFEQSFTAANGYQKFPSGLIIQWGKSASIAGEDSTTVTFGTTFNTCLNVSATIEIDISGHDNAAAVLSFTNTQATLGRIAWNTASADGAIYYIAIGY